MDVDGLLLEVIGALLGANLVGVYAYDTALEAAPGTLALLIVTTRDLTRDRKYGLTQTLLRHATRAGVREALVVRQTDLLPTQPSLLVQLHYTESERPALTAAVGSTVWLRWPDGPSGSVDPTALVQRLQETGRALIGCSLPELFGDALAPVETLPAPTHPTTADRQLRFE